MGSTAKGNRLCGHGSLCGWLEQNEILGQCSGGDDDDRYNFLLHVEPMSPERWQHYEPRMRRQTRRLVRRYRHEIQRVARKLLERHTLTQDEIDAELLTVRYTAVSPDR
jgi:hypothetical protein